MRTFQKSRCLRSCESELSILQICRTRTQKVQVQTEVLFFEKKDSTKKTERKSRPYDCNTLVLKYLSYDTCKAKQVKGGCSPFNQYKYKAICSHSAVKMICNPSAENSREAAGKGQSVEWWMRQQRFPLSTPGAKLAF